MIKKFEQFTKNVKSSLNENKYPYDATQDYLTNFNLLIGECSKDNIERLMEYDGIFKLKMPQTFYFYMTDRGNYGDVSFENISPKKIVSFELDDDVDFAEDLFGENICYHLDDNFIVAITDDGERIPIDYWTCPAETIIEINMTLDR
jgi:hypothetical protein